MTGSENGQSPGSPSACVSLMNACLQAEINEVLRIAAGSCGVRCAALTAVNGSEIVSMARYGDGPAHHAQESSLCGLALATGQAFSVDDLLASGAPLLPTTFARESGYRFFASSPVQDSDGRMAAVLCVFDREPKALNDVQRGVLDLCAAHVAARLRSWETSKHGERQKAELESALERLDLHQTVVSNMVEGVSVASAASGRILYANSTFERMFGYPPGGLVGLHVSALNSPRSAASPDTVAASIVDEIRQSGLATGEFLNVRCDGTDFITRYRIVALEHPRLGRIWISVQEDVTERKRSEESLRRAEERLRESQRMEAIGRLAGGISHEFNNLMTGILVQSELALENLPAGSIDRARVAEIRDSTLRAAALTHQLLAFSGRQILQPSPTDLNASLQKLAGRIQEEAGRAVHVRIRPSASELWANVDPLQFENILVQLGKSAKERLPEGGTLDLGMSAEPAGGTTGAGPWVRLLARDSSRALEAEKLARIFEPFRDPTAPHPESGLALAVVYGIVHQSGGVATAHSSPEAGLEISIRLPAIAAPEVRQKPQSSVDRFRGTETVLVVEDEPTVRGVVRQVLQSRGYSVIDACCAEEALAVLEQRAASVHLVLSDLLMPGMSGRTLAKRVQERWPGIALVLMSGFDSRGERESDFGADIPFIAKPFSPKALLKSIRTAIDARQGR